MNEDVSFTLNATDRHAVAFSQDSYTKYSENDKCGALRATGGMYGGGSETLVYSTSKNSYHTEAEENLANTLVASDYKDPPTVNSPEYIVRRLTQPSAPVCRDFPTGGAQTSERTSRQMKNYGSGKRSLKHTEKIIGSAVKPKSEKADPYMAEKSPATLPSTSCGEMCCSAVCLLCAFGDCVLYTANSKIL